MVKINGKEFPVYDLDTMDSILSRIAADMNTIPRYLYFPNGALTIQQLLSDDDVPVQDLMVEIEDLARNTVEFQKVYDTLAPKMKQRKLSLRSDVFVPFIVYGGYQDKGQPTFKGYPMDYANFAFLQIQKEVDTNKWFDPPLPNVDEIWQQREATRKKDAEAVRHNKNKARQQLTILNEFAKVKEGVPYTLFELQKVTFDITLDLADMSLLEIFNHIKLNTIVPFATARSFYKILKDFIPPSDWSISPDDGIIFRVLEKVNTANTKMDDFREALVVVEGEPGEEVVTASLDLNTSGNNVSRDEFIQRFLSSLADLGDIKTKKSQETKVNGVFFFPQFALNKYVLADLIMNNPLFSSLLSIDESEKATKQKTSIYVHFNLPRIGYLAAYITEKTVERGDPNLKGKDKKLFPLHSKYIMVTVSKAENVEAVEAFQNILSRLLVKYNEEYKGIVAFYRRFIPDFAKKEPTPPPVVSKAGLRATAPEIFYPHYSRICLQRPRLVEDDEVKEEEKAGKQVMVFPKEGEGSPSRNYVCDNSKFPRHIYPGVRDNPLPNKEQFPYVPCCYTKNQMNMPGSKYRHYMYGETLPTRGGQQQDLYKTNKFVPANAFGTLPRYIARLFDILDPDPMYTYVRKGVQRSKSSFLNCVAEAMDEALNGAVGILEIDPNDRESFLTETRREMSGETSAAVCRQEMYDFTIPEIMEAIRNSDVYLDPKLFVHLLEVQYGCNIFIFTRKHINGEMTLPRHLQAYYKSKSAAPSVFILEHLGSESDHATYPQCELIIRWKIDSAEDVRYSFPNDWGITEGIQTASGELRKAYTLNKTIPEQVFPWKSNEAVLSSQSIDSYGKTRMLRVKYKGQTVTVLTGPLQPLNVPESNDKRVSKVRLRLANEMLASLGAILTKQTVVHDVVKEIEAKLGNVSIFIPIEDGVKMGGVPDFKGALNYTDNEVSVINTYNQSKKVSRYIVEYMFWLYSRFLHDKGIDEMGQGSMLRFRNERVKVDKGFRYGDIPKAFSTNSGVMSGGKLVLRSQEVLKRLIYVLRLAVIRSPSKIFRYRSRKMIEQYYVDITDFSQYTFQVVLEGDSSVAKWIAENKISYQLHDTVVLGRESPYFFKNDLVSRDVLLAQNTDTLGKAMEIGVIWAENGFNVGSEAEDMEGFAFTLYSYAHGQDIVAYKVEGAAEEYGLRILGYKVGDDEFYTALLPLK